MKVIHKSVDNFTSIYNKSVEILKCEFTNKKGYVIIFVGNIKVEC